MLLATSTFRSSSVILRHAAAASRRSPRLFSSVIGDDKDGNNDDDGDSSPTTTPTEATIPTSASADATPTADPPADLPPDVEKSNTANANAKPADKADQPGWISTIALRPSEVVSELNRHIVGQADAKRAVAIAMRNRWRRRQLPAELLKEVTPRNVLMIGPTGS